MYRTPFTMSGKAHGDISDQYMKKTILTTEEHFPYVRARIKVWERNEVSSKLISIMYMCNGFKKEIINPMLFVYHR